MRNGVVKLGLVLVPALVTVLCLGGCDRFRSPHERGVRYLGAGRYQDAVQAFTQAIDEATASGDVKAEAIAYANRCYSYDMLNQQAQAIPDCNRSLELVPDDAEVINNRGVAFMGNKALDDAERDFDKAIELRPDYAEAYANRGRLWLEREDYDRALEDLDKAIGLDANLAQAYANRAFAKENVGKKDEALEDYGRSLDLLPDALTYFSRGMLHLRFAEFDAAYLDFKAAARLEPDSYVGYMASTEAKFLENRPPDAAKATPGATDEAGASAPLATAGTPSATAATPSATAATPSATAATPSATAGG
jgi:tetratricopeptide (TPR) repeat protein